MDIVKVSEKSGIYVTSAENAYAYLQKFNSRKDIREIRQKIKELQSEKLKIEKEINKYLDIILEYSMKSDSLE
jgi:hypothetical protein